MLVFKIKELLEKNKISRYKLRQYSTLSYERINDYYFGRVKSFKAEELEQLCEIFNCNIQDIIEYKKHK
ncbi:MAG: helix-turn-helix transcriptional regulator [Bacilli bacterium]|nr:helix-turn-helix transcriptional regulator [Bacilli bacterium]